MRVVGRAQTIVISTCAICDKDRDPLDVPEVACGHSYENRRSVGVEFVPLVDYGRAIAALRKIRDHGRVEGHECWALHQGDCADVFQEIARATLASLGEAE